MQCYFLFFPNVNGFSLKAWKSDWFLCDGEGFSFAGKNCELEQKKMQFGNNLQQ